MILIKNDAVNAQIEHFRTWRMVAERLTAGDFEDIRRLHLQPEVIMTLSVDCETLPDKATHEELEHDVAHWEQHGFGLWVFRDIKDGQFLGRGGLKWYRINDKDVVGLDYAVMFGHWNRGLATEMAQCQPGDGFRTAQLPGSRLLGTADQLRLAAGDGKSRVSLPGRLGLRRPAVPFLPANSGRMETETGPTG